jgi:hypothetical protein
MAGSGESGAGESGAFLRSPLVLGGAAVMTGVLLALLLGGLGLFGAPTDATASPTAPSGSPAPSPSLVAVGSGEPSPGFTLDPGVTPAPPTAAPTPKPAKTPKPTPTANTNPTILEFDAPKTVDCTSPFAVTIHLTWRVINATGVTLSIDGGGLYNSYPGFSGSDDVPFGCDDDDPTHTYTLRTTGGTGPADEVTRSVKWGAPKIVSFEMGRADCPDTAATVGIDMSYEIKFATGAELWRNEVLMATYSSKVVDTSGINFECIWLEEGRKLDRTFTLITTGGFGTPATMEFTVKRQLP